MPRIGGVNQESRGGAGRGELAFGWATQSTPLSMFPSEKSFPKILSNIQHSRPTPRILHFQSYYSNNNKPIVHTS